jgi:outer membrane protein assembly factor BamB
MPPRFRTLVLVFVSALSAPSAVNSADWVHWRGPFQTGVSTEKLPDSFGVTTPGKDNLVWKADVGGRTAPLIVGDKLFLVTSIDEAKPTEGERLVCLNANTGKVEWEDRFAVFHTDIVSNRLGWCTLTADPANGLVYIHGTQGFVSCYTVAGKLVWKRSLTEEYGRITGYGGRIVSPLFDSGLVIVGMVNASWGDFAPPGNRFVAFDGKTGEVVWWATTGITTGRTYYSIPVVSVVNGQRVFVTGGADGGVHAFKVRTGEKVWSYVCASGAVNPSPVMDGNLVYIAHGEENPEPGTIGRVVCLDASKVDPKTKKPAVVWENKTLQKRFGLASPALADGILYVPNDEAELYAFDAKKGGRPLWRYKFGTVARGAPLVCDGKLYVFDVFGKLSVLKLNGKSEPEESDVISFRSTTPGAQLETNGTPAAVNGRLYFMTREATYCVGAAANKPSAPVAVKFPSEEPAFDGSAKPAGVRIFPADVVAKPGEAVKFTAIPVDANGRDLPAAADAKPEWGVFAPPVPPGGTTAPPPLKAEVKGDGYTATVMLDKMPMQHGIVTAKLGTAVGRARVRVVPPLPYKNDFEKTPDGAAPAGWVNAGRKYEVKTVNGQKVLAKTNTDAGALVAKATTFFTLPTSTGYAIQCDVMGTEVRGKVPDAGVVNSRYTLLLDGKDDPTTGHRALRLTSWEARPRVNQSVELQWEPGTWYTLKLVVEGKGATAVARGKVWKKGDPEPAKWSIEYEDAAPNLEGSAGLYGYISNISVGIPGSEVFYDNLAVTPTGK